MRAVLLVTAVASALGVGLVGGVAAEAESATWVVNATFPSSTDAQAIACPNDQVCFATNTGSGIGDIFATISGGANWATQTTPSSGYLTAISCPTTARCYATDTTGRVVSTQDG